MGEDILYSLTASACTSLLILVPITMWHLFLKREMSMESYRMGFAGGSVYGYMTRENEAPRSFVLYYTPSSYLYHMSRACPLLSQDGKVSSLSVRRDDVNGLGICEDCVPGDGNVVLINRLCGCKAPFSAKRNAQKKDDAWNEP